MAVEGATAVQRALAITRPEQGCSQEQRQSAHWLAGRTVLLLCAQVVAVCAAAFPIMSACMVRATAGGDMLKGLLLLGRKQRF